ncbi:MAG: hypothetical protein ACE5FC_08925 [Myxococcota bacterium]
MPTASNITSRRRKAGAEPGLALLLFVATLLPAGAAAAPAGAGACPTPLSVLKAGEPRPSCSRGTRAHGRLLHGASLPDAGCGFRRIFAHRDERYGTDEIISALSRAGARLAGGAFKSTLPGGGNPLLGVGNISPPPRLRMEKDPFVGKRFSVSHTSGRAADLAYFILDRRGRPAQSFETGIGYRGSGLNASGYRRYFLPAGSTNGPRPQRGCQMAAAFFGLNKWKCFIAEGSYRFDDERNWALVRALLLDPEIGVVDAQTGRVRPRDEGIRRMLISSPLRARLLAQARRTGTPSPLVDLAAAVLKQPGNASPHDDHLHVDLNCAPGDIEQCGCVNSGIPPRPHVGERIPLHPEEGRQITRIP